MKMVHFIPIAFLLFIFRIDVMAHDSHHESFPWVVSLAYNGNHMCVGSIINARIVVTAASCVEGKSFLSIRIRVGSIQHLTGGLLMELTGIESHPGFNEETHSDDIALLFTKHNIEFNKKVMSVPIASAQLKGSIAALVTGWYKHEGTYLSNQLQFTEVKTKSIEDCANEVPKYFNKLSMYCSQVVKYSKCVCRGDTGGPMIINDTLHGISSWGNGCGAPEHPAVFTAVYFYNDWIKEIADNKNLSHNIVKN